MFILSSNIKIFDNTIQVFVWILVAIVNSSSWRHHLTLLYHDVTMTSAQITTLLAVDCHVGGVTGAVAVGAPVLAVGVVVWTLSCGQGEEYGSLFLFLDQVYDGKYKISW